MQSLPKDLPQFQSFFQAGFECTSALAEGRRRLDLLGATQHERLCREDYCLLREQGMSTVREGISWSFAAKNGLDRYRHLMQIAKDEGVQQIWDLNHFDYPDGVDPFSDQFVTQFAEHAKKCLFALREYISGPLYIAPINEISFFAWIGADKGWWAPYTKGRGKGELFKKQLVRAALAAIRAIKKEDHTVRFIHIDPFMQRFIHSPASPLVRRHVEEFNTIIRFEAWDMISGRVCPELGGDPSYLDIIGVNYYIHNQEWVGQSPGKRGLTFQAIPWKSPARISLATLLRTVYERYHRPLVISETGSFGAMRKQWWKRTLAQTKEALDDGLPIAGICAYPVLDRPADAGYLLPESGLWDFAPEDPSCLRYPYKPALASIRHYQTVMRRWFEERAEQPGMTDQQMLLQKIESPKRGHSAHNIGTMAS